MSGYDDVSYAVADGIATITIERPDVYNAFTRTTVLELNDAARTAEADEGVYAAVLTGAGDGFCSGADTTEMPDWDQQSPEEYGAYLWLIQQFVWRLRTMATPTIAAVNGPAIGAGCDFALACDLRVVGEEGVMREGFVDVGLVPGDGGAWLLPRLVGESKAREYLLTGRDITPEDAVDIGLAVERADDALTAADDLAAEIRDKPATAVQHTNRLVDPQQSFDEYCRQATEYQWDCVIDDEHREAVAAFNEGREPDFDRAYDD
ncbi:MULTISPECIES: enoyl-CoA hydratase/isomerase family protein [Haloarcula]|uniref:Enoyl-CoA hydratase n=1 Tax=Haloarcula pellucida TaxID=1427151 RepID=A0A830GPV4_9EURY|nr:MULTISPECIES: enoyl-CoA hydratase/isomerase family protein [Halomicroarcula]MBX0350333.1 enoyl-CoA hydratase/isomerase family protein [Halomicroarcula pellucida]MDS0277565.1 enoyl-CoA hydratase/isomerase family protein [Halomicroarcula sp. S1AR25-4]GGO01561.1 enoyl-CoA hydratase [Halomicroarcula pellucida]